MDEFKNTMNNIDHELSEVVMNYNLLKNNINQSNNRNVVVGTLSHLSDIKEIIWLLNDKILNLNDNIESGNVNISKAALDRIENNKIIKKILNPYLPYLLLNLCAYNT